LRIEPLEVRHLLDAAGLAALVTPAWFGTVTSDPAEQHAGVAAWTAEDTIISSAQIGTPQAAQPGVYDWIVQFNTAALAGVSSVAQTASLLVGGGIDFEVLHGLGLAGQVLVRSSGASLDAVEGFFRNDAYVATFEQDAVSQQQVQPNDPQLSNLWAMTSIDAQAAWGITTGSSSVVVAVIDTGVDYTHPDLAANIWTKPSSITNDGFTGDVHGYNFVSDNGNVMDDNGHGTHVSGTIGAVGNNGIGVVGVNWSVSIMPLKFMSSSGTGYLSDAIEAMNYATMMRTQYGVNVRVDNCSWGGGGFSSAMETAIEAANDAGILVVVAAGNNASNNDAVAQYPANYDSPNVISVAALAQNGQLASFSNYGATTVDIAAPGVSIYSTIPNDSYAYYSGTSMAAPQVSGVAALCWAVDPNATVADVRNAILHGADSLPALSGKVACGGKLDAYKTLQLIEALLPQGPAVSSLTASPGSVTAGASLTLTAAGITDPSGTVTQVLFYRDANNNGQYDATDPLVGSTTVVSGGTASLTLSTTGLAAGTYHYFAKAVDNHSHSSAVATATVTVLAGDGFGNTAATAGAVAVPSSTSGTLEFAGDTDWFKFQATAGKSYVFSTVLGTLRDSVLYLYGSNGKTQLAFNDDYGASLASRIAWTAPASGTYYLVVGGYGGKLSGSFVLNVQMPGSTTVQSKALAAGMPAFVPDAADVSTVPPAGLAKAAWASLAFDPTWGQDAATLFRVETFGQQSPLDASLLGPEQPSSVYGDRVAQTLADPFNQFQLLSPAAGGGNFTLDAIPPADGLPQLTRLAADAVDACLGVWDV
jgi:subtilisin family serine protease